MLIEKIRTLSEVFAVLGYTLIQKVQITIIFNSFLGGNKLQSTGNKTEDLKGTECVKSTPITSVQIPEVKSDTVSEPVTPASLAALQSDVQPVGHDYVEEVLI